MYTLLIVEDERWEREGLVQLIDAKRYGLDRVCTACDGVEGLRRIRELTPDIVITDIRMPGLSGLEMLEQAGGALAGSVCIILSGYNEFAYAQKALRIGAADFLVKPVKEEELQDALERAVCELDRRPVALRSPVDALDAARLAEGAVPTEQLAAQFGVPRLDGLGLAALSGAREEAELPPLRWRAGETMLCVLRERDALPEGGYAAAGVTRIAGDADFYAAVGRAQEALERARFHRAVRPVTDAPGAPACGAVRLRLEQLLVRHAVDSRQEARLTDALARVRRRMDGDLRLDRSTALAQMQRLTAEGDAPQDAGAENARLLCACTVEELLDAAHALLAERMRGAARALSAPEAYVVRRVIETVDAHYREPELNLQQLAGRIYLSPNYVGALFKKSAGVTFNDYLGLHRLLAAAELLAGGGMRVAAVAATVGIPNVSYFCVQFRGAFGVTPGAFRKAMERER